MREEKLGANSIDTSGWLAELDRAPAVKGLGRGVWCETSKPSESPAPVDAKVEDAKVEDTTDVVSFANIFSAGRFDGTTLDDFLENDEAGGDMGRDLEGFDEAGYDSDGHRRVIHWSR